MDPRIIDKRVVKRNINKGLISKDQYDKHIAALPDMVANSELVKEKLYGNAEEDEIDDDDDDDDDAEVEDESDAEADE